MLMLTKEVYVIYLRYLAFPTLCATIISDLSFACYIRSLTVLQHVILNKFNFLSNYYEVNVARMAAYRLFSHVSLAKASRNKEERHKADPIQALFFEAT